MKTGLILEGGAVRGIFTAGVLDRLMENGIYYPYVCWRFPQAAATR